MPDHDDSFLLKLYGQFAKLKQNSVKDFVLFTERIMKMGAPGKRRV